ncbi:12-oxophytodienoate reductase [Skermanella stibiiresistens SB22]|uniref:12-oxophytodienoate reductase n=1 Tax=Skermanella stibiiresistens SB22 TaxID=1385369 RepID=W9H661_9PROT|nr:alkene reductase [Skermanella stibiiresistens]EWY40172.1 12-oxophytodienoate reductase [Skermanella stibiiresistens SB22]
MTSKPESDLFQPVKLGPYALANRIVMAPLTRSRANKDDAPYAMHAEYYGQRATAGLIISEATQISRQGKGYAYTPGIHSEAQVAGWKLVTDAVHAKGGRIFLQLWHVGRISHPSLQIDNALPVAPSAIKPEGQAFTEAGFVPFVTPRALELDEIPGVIEQYRTAAENAKLAGFDGVEVHAANGYLLDQFLRDGTNKRTDAYGGSIENRARLMLEATEAVVGVWGGDRVGIRLSPTTPANDIADSDPEPVFSHAVEQLNRFGLAYIHLVEGSTGASREVSGAVDYHKLRRLFNGLYIANNLIDRETAIKLRQDGDADLVAFGRPFISNPDLVERLRIDAPLAEANKDTFYGGGAEGYTDYPFLSDVDRQAAAD